MLPFFCQYHLDRGPKRSRVAILDAEQYSQQLDQILGERLRPFPINVRGKTVVLKPNLVDLPGDAINTHPTLGMAAVDSAAWELGRSWSPSGASTRYSVGAFSEWL